MNNNPDWPKTNAHFIMIDKTIEILENEEGEISQQKLGEKIGEQEDAITGSTAEKYLSDSDKKSYWKNNEPVKILEKPDTGGRATVYWIHEKHFNEEEHGKWRRRQ